MKSHGSITKPAMGLIIVLPYLLVGALTMTLYIKESVAVPVIIKESNMGREVSGSQRTEKDWSRPDAIPVPRSIEGSSRSIEAIGAKHNDKRDGDADKKSLFSGTDSDSPPFASSHRIPEARKLDFDPSPLQPNDIHVKQNDGQVSLNSESVLNDDSEYSDDKGDSNAEDDYSYFVPAHKQLPRPAPTPASITVLLATEEEVEEEKAPEETQISDLSQGNFNSSKATFSSPFPTSLERVNLILDSRESQTADLAEATEVPNPAPTHDDERRESQIPGTVGTSHEQPDGFNVYQLEAPSILTSRNKSVEGDPGMDQSGEGDLINSFEIEGEEDKQSPLFPILHYKEPHFYYRDSVTTTSEPSPDSITALPQQHGSARNQSSLSGPQVAISAKGDGSDIDDDPNSVVTYHQITKETRVIGTRKPVETMAANVLQFGFVLVSLLTLAAAFMTNTNNRATVHRYNAFGNGNGIVSLQSRHPHIFQLSNQLKHTPKWLKSSPFYNSAAARRSSIFALGDYSDDDD